MHNNYNTKGLTRLTKIIRFRTLQCSSDIARVQIFIANLAPLFMISSAQLISKIDDSTAMVKSHLTRNSIIRVRCAGYTMDLFLTCPHTLKASFSKGSGFP